MEGLSPTRLRFAVGIFDSAERFRNGLQDLGARGLVLDNMSCLALRSVLAQPAVTAPLQEPLRIAHFLFAGNSEPIACTCGPLADRLCDATGAGSLRDALGMWLVPRHAGYLQDAVEAGNIQLWMRIANAEDERRACRSLLSHSSGAVGVHDLIARPNGRNP